MSGLPWIKLYGNVPDHPKSDLLEDILGVERAWTHVVELWLWASRVRPNGNLGGLSDAVIAKRSGWTHSVETFVSALVESGWLNEDRTLAGWDEHQGAHVRKVERDRQRRKAKPATTPQGESKEPATNPRGFRATPEGEIESEREKEIPPSGGVGGPTSSPAPKPPRKPRVSHQSLAAVLADTRSDGVTWAEHWATKFTQLDGQELRPSLEDTLEAAWDHKARRKRSDMPRYLGKWLLEEAARVQDRMDRTARRAGGVARYADRPSAGPPTHDLHGNPITLPPSWVWDANDERYRAEGRVWLGDRWGSVPANWNGAAA